jgi:lipopolysaccharide export system protein LptA
MRNLLKMISKRHKPHHYIGLCLFGLLIIHSLVFAGVGQRRPDTRKEDSKVYLLHADTFRYKQFANQDAQVLNGNVRFRHEAVLMFCDSAYFYKNQNSFEAFGHVRMEQGDTLSLVGDYLKYDGNSKIAEVRYNVKMMHHNSILLTDSLNYDRLYDLGYFFEGGKLIDQDNVLTSDWGEYSPSTREAIFNYNVKLDNPKFVLTSDTLHYNTLSKQAHIVGPSNIVSGDTHIYSESGYYNTDTQQANLFDRSVVMNKGSRLTGDSLFYDKYTGDMHAFRNVIYEDKINKHILEGHYCTYNEQNGKALVTDSALAKEFSGGVDTMYVHADTFRVYTFNIQTDSVYRMLHAYYHVRSYRTDIQSVCDSLTYDTRSARMVMYDNPIVWNWGQQLLGEEIHMFMNDSTVDSVHVINQALLVERMDSVYYNQVTGRLMKAFFDQGVLVQNQVIGNVEVAYYPLDSDSLIIGLNRFQSSELRMFMKEKKMSKMWSPQSEGILYPLTLAPPEENFLSNFVWFDYIRPQNKDDIFEWRAKKAGTELKETVRRQAPVQFLKNVKKKVD